MSQKIYECNLELEKLFDKYNSEYFQNKIKNVEVKWSNRLTSTAGITNYHGKKDDTEISLSLPLLSLRPRKDLVETLLHEMIHAYLFVVDGDKEREEHGPKFHRMMDRINDRGGHHITVFHDFDYEVEKLQNHWWKCSGKCSHLSPKHGIVKRAMDRAPGPSEPWWLDHNKECKGKFVKVKEPKCRTSSCSSASSVNERKQFRTSSCTAVRDTCKLQKSKNR